MAQLIDLTFEYMDEELDYLYGDVFNGACSENTKNLLNTFYSLNTVEAFLRDEDVHIPLFPTTVTQAKDTINYDYDTDGVVIELKYLMAIKAHLHYLLVGKVVGPTLQTQGRTGHLDVLEKSRMALRPERPSIQRPSAWLGHHQRKSVRLSDAEYLFTLTPPTNM